MEWPLREMFLAYVDLMKAAAGDSYKNDILVWAVLAAAGSKMKQPEPPAVLRAPKIVIGG